MPKALRKPRNLTNEIVERLPLPADRQYENYYDALVPGLLLRVNQGGKKAWHVLHYVKGVDKDGHKGTFPRTRTLKPYPILKVKEAREQARKFLADPQKALAQASAGNFREVAESFIKRHVAEKKLRSQPEIERCLNKYIYPSWQHRPFRELQRSHVNDLLDEIQDKHGSRQADMCLAIIRKMMNWYTVRNNDYVSPIVRGMHRTEVGDRKRKRILDDDEIRALFQVTEDAGTFGVILKVLLLTAQRREKVVTMQWSDVVGGEWKIASETREKSHAGKLRLPSIVLDLIQAQPRIAGNPYIFAGGHGRGPFNSFSQRKQELDVKLPDMPSWVLHDLRRTARSLMSRAGVLPHISERVLGHAIPGVEGVYDHYDYTDEKAQALKQLANLIERIVNPPEDNVVALRRTRRRR